MRVAFAVEARPPHIPWRGLGILVLCLILSVISLLIFIVVLGAAKFVLTGTAL